ncbi:MAG: AAA family ATPase [Bermanella sp.]
MGKNQSAAPSYVDIGERIQQLDMLQHVQEFSSMVVLVTGETGSGKSSLLQAAVSQLSVHHQILVIDAVISANESSLIQQLSQQLVCGGSLEDIDVSLMKISEQNESVHLVIDDAHLLEESAFRLITRKAIQDHSWHLVICGDNSLQSRLDNFQQELQQENTYHLIQLAPFNETESAQFIEALFQQAGQDFTQLSDKKRHQLWLLSDGLPGKLVDLVELEKETYQNLSSKFPVGHVAAILLIGTALIFSYFYQEKTVTIAQDDVIAELLAQKVQPKKQFNRENINAETLSKKIQKGVLVSTSKVENSEKAQKPSKSLLAQTANHKSAELPVSGSKSISVLVPKATKPAPLTVAPVQKKMKSIHPLLDALPQEYALQLLGVRNKKSAQDFMSRFSRQLNSEKLNVYETKYKGQPWFVVVYGPYSNKSNASQEAISLSRSLKSQPWVRPMAKIQEDIRKLNSK